MDRDLTPEEVWRLFLEGNIVVHTDTKTGESRILSLEEANEAWGAAKQKKARSDDPS